MRDVISIYKNLDIGNISLEKSINSGDYTLFSRINEDNLDYYGNIEIIVENYYIDTIFSPLGISKNSVKTGKFKIYIENCCIKKSNCRYFELFNLVGLYIGENNIYVE